MYRTTALALIVGGLAGFAHGPAAAAEKVDHPKLRAALHELREARRELETAKDIWPPGYKERALASTQDAMNSLKTILAVKDVNAFRGVDRNPDFYKRLGDHPRLRAALHDLRDARDELRTARADFNGLKERALDDIDAAVGDIVTLIRYRPRR
jgi:hypothetical protein